MLFFLFTHIFFYAHQWHCTKYAKICTVRKFLQSQYITRSPYLHPPPSPARNPDCYSWCLQVMPPPVSLHVVGSESSHLATSSSRVPTSATPPHVRVTCPMGPPTQVMGPGQRPPRCTVVPEGHRVTSL